MLSTGEPESTKQVPYPSVEWGKPIHKHNISFHVVSTIMWPYRNLIQLQRRGWGGSQVK